MRHEFSEKGMKQLEKILTAISNFGRIISNVANGEAGLNLRLEELTKEIKEFREQMEKCRKDKHE